MGIMIRDWTQRIRTGYRIRNDFPVSSFKLQILRTLIEFDESNGSNETIKILNKLKRTCAVVMIGQLQLFRDKPVDLRVASNIGSATFTFDGLSSGQKDIISILCLIWNHDRNRPFIVFINEPDLRLNSQWHRTFVPDFDSLAPQNKCILATHSEDVMDSVGANRRALHSI